jgi:hypothetical protein
VAWSAAVLGCISTGEDRQGWDTKAGDAPVDAIVVPEGHEEFLAVAAPLARRVQGQNKRLPLLVVKPADANATQILMSRLGVERAFLLSGEFSEDDRAGLGEGIVDSLAMGGDRTAAGIRIATRYWGAPREIVLAPVQTPAALIYGAALAAHRGAPLVPVEPEITGERLAEAVSPLQAERVVVVFGDEQAEPSWACFPAYQCCVMRASAVREELGAALATAPVHAIVLARTPDPGSPVGAGAWLAPYYSLARNAPVVLTGASGGSAAEDLVMAFIRRHGLVPRSVAILADYEAIERIAVEDPILEGLTVAVEPCAGAATATASVMGVGRIPFKRSGMTSQVLALGLARDRAARTRSPPRVTMIANPSTDYGPLPMCETISRATVEECRNVRLKVDAFFGTPAGEPAVVEAAENAEIVIFEGHISDQALFQDRSGGWQAVPATEYARTVGITDDDTGEYDPCGGADVEVLDEGDYAGDPWVEAGDADDPDGEHDGKEPVSPWWPWGEGEQGRLPTAGGHAGAVLCPPSVPVMPSPVPARPPLDLRRRPLVILQSCHSLGEPLGEVIFTAGAAGCIGTTTNVHSASGSAFIKSFMHGILYRGDTVGEALRDARNYFVSLAWLKDKRGHSEQPKVYRVALSFALWGDPELRILHGKPRKPKKGPADATFVAPDRVRLDIPFHRLRQVRTPAYVARMAPGAETAGIVMRIKNKPYRRLAPLYFFRVRVPDGFYQRRYGTVRREDGELNRTTFLPDPFGRYCYLLYYPEKELRHEAAELLFE